MSQITFPKTTVLPCQKEPVSISNVDFSLCDPLATGPARKLAAFLNGVSESGFLLYGHQNDLHMKAGPETEPLSCSDTFDSTGHFAGVTGLDALCLVGTENGRFYWSREKRIQSCVDLAMKSIQNGAVVSLSAHMPNFQIIWEWKNGITPLPELHHFEDDSKEADVNGGYKTWPVELEDGSTNFYGYSPNALQGSVMQDILPGKKLNGLYTEYLDLVCDFCLELAKKDVAIMWRPFHENSGNWFWWGRTKCTPQEFKDVWQYTFQYFTQVRGVHNLVWCYSPGSEYGSVEEYESRYPGDAFVDLVGFDMYQQWPHQGTAFWAAFEQQCNIVCSMALKHKKLFATTETGIMRPENKALLDNGNPEKDWYVKVAQICRKYKAAYFLLWANFGPDRAYYSPYATNVEKSDGKITALQGHEMLDSFIEFYNLPWVIFAG